MVFFAFIGFDTVSTAAGEPATRSATCRSASSASLAISTVLYVAVAAVLTGLVPYRDLDVADPIAKAFDAIGLALVRGR